MIKAGSTVLEWLLLSSPTGQTVRSPKPPPPVDSKQVLDEESTRLVSTWSHRRGAAGCRHQRPPDHWDHWESCHAPGNQTGEPNPPTPPPLHNQHPPTTCNASVSHLPLSHRPPEEGRGGGRGWGVGEFKETNKKKNLIRQQHAPPDVILLLHKNQKLK